jgi:P-type conjugative transfer protein TrbJ
MRSSQARKPLKAFYGAIAAALISFSAVHTADAQIPVTDVASLLQQIQSYLQIVSQYETQLRQFQTQIQQYQNMIQNTSQLLNGGSWTNIQSALSGINSILTNGQSIMTTVSNTSARVAALYPSYASLLTSQITQSSYQSSYQALSDNTRLGFSAALNSLGQLNAGVNGDSNTIRSLQQQAATTSGNLQALQSVASIDSEALVLMQQTKELLMTNLGAVTQYFAQQQELDAEREAATQKALIGTFPGFGTGKSYSYDNTL